MASKKATTKSARKPATVPNTRRPKVAKMAAAPARKEQRAIKPAAKSAAKPAVKPGAKVAAKITAKPPGKPVVKVVKAKAKCVLDAKTLQMIRDTLIKTRDRLTGQITALANDSLKYIDDTSSEDRTDDFDREFALNLVSSEHDAVFEIDSALRRIDERTYGLCEVCGCALERARLMALPFARCCVKCQSDTERGRSRYRPFGESLAQNVEAAQEPAEAEETE
jgi:DnaK suppressor protein